MDETMRKALEQEFDEKSARLSEMMEQMPAMQQAYQQYEAALRAFAVKELENAMKEEEDEVKRMNGHCQRAQEQVNAATKTGDPTYIAQCKEARAAEQLAMELAQRRLAEAKARYAEALSQHGFEDEAAYRAAFMAKPAFMKLEKNLQPFREEYAALLARCEEIEALLSKEE